MSISFLLTLILGCSSTKDTIAEEDTASDTGANSDTGSPSDTDTSSNNDTSSNTDTNSDTNTNTDTSTNTESIDPGYNILGFWLDDAPQQNDACGVEEGIVRPVEISVNESEQNSITIEVISEEQEGEAPLLICSWGDDFSFT
ncbi:MAG: hypothetical protein CMK59_05760, partial [Proteobacteria bacterium]|nr:hypothetical protein [Pseudomonadota bacterium]